MSAEVIFVGSGINSLVGAALGAREGAKVMVLERQAHLGGNILTDEIIAPGFKQDVYSGFHPLFVSSPAYAILEDDLSAHGLTYLNTSWPTAAVMPDHRAAFLNTDRLTNVTDFDSTHPGDGVSWRDTMKRFEETSELGFGMLGSELWVLPGIKLLGAQMIKDGGVEETLSRFGRMLAPARAWLEQTFEDEVHRALFSPWILHMGLGPEDAASGYINQLISASLEQTGMPVPKGGGDALVKALVKLIEAHGGTCLTDVHVDDLIIERGEVKGVRSGDREYLASKAVACNVTPHQLYQSLLDPEHVPAEVASQVRRFRYGRANMQLHFALSEKPRWKGERGERLGEVAIVHLTDGVDGVSRSVNEATRGLLPAQATVVCGQHCAVDPSRAPDGGWTLWIQLQELPSHPRGDAAGTIEVGAKGWGDPDLKERYADRIQARLAHHIEGFEESIIGRMAMSPRDLEGANVNLVGGDPYSGSCQLDQFLLWRPLGELQRHRTPVDGLYHIGASTHPGPGLHGSSGYLLAKEMGWVE